MDDLIRTHPELFPVFFVVMWLAVNGILGALSGWFPLMERYPVREEAPLLTLRNQSGTMNLVAMSGVLTLGVSQSGLRVGMTKILGIRLFGLFQRDFFVPWHELAVVRKKGFFGRSARLEFGKPALGKLTIAGDLADRLAQAAGRNWPEATLPPAPDRAKIAGHMFRQWLFTTAFAAAFFTLAPRLAGAKGDFPPLAVTILFPAIAIGIPMLIRYFQRTRG